MVIAAGWRLIGGVGGPAARVTVTAPIADKFFIF